MAEARLERGHLAPIRAADLHRWRAEALLAAGEPEAALAAARLARGAYRRHGRDWFALRAELTELRAREAGGRSGRGAGAAAVSVASRLEAEGADEAAQAWLLAARLSRVDATHALRMGAGHRTHRLPLVRASGWLAHALEREVAGGPARGAVGVPSRSGRPRPPPGHARQLRAARPRDGLRRRPRGPRPRARGGHPAPHLPLVERALAGDRPGRAAGATGGRRHRGAARGPARQRPPAAGRPRRGCRHRPAGGGTGPARGPRAPPPPPGDRIVGRGDRRAGGRPAGRGDRGHGVRRARGGGGRAARARGDRRAGPSVRRRPGGRGGAGAHLRALHAPPGRPRAAGAGRRRGRTPPAHAARSGRAPRCRSGRS